MTIAIPSLRAITCTPQWVRNDLWRRARALPTLDLRFAENKSLVDGISGQNLITFTRASGGTYVDSAGVLQTAGANEPSFDHNPTTGESLGLLVEEQRTNLLLRSEEFDNASWILFSGSLATNSLASPNGLTTADTCTATAGLTTTIYQVVSCTASTTYTFSFYARLGTLPAADFRIAVRDDSNATFIAQDVIPSITPVTTEWRRIAYTFTTPVGCTLVRPYLIRFSSSSGGTIHFWGAQLEAGAFPTSYIPTTGTAATRNADVADIINTAIANGIRTLYAEFRSPASGIRGVVSLNDNTANERAAINTSGVDPRLVVVDGGVTQADIDAGTIVASARSRMAVRISANNFAASFNGGAVVTDTSGTLPTVDRLFIGRTQAGEYLNAPIARLVGWREELPDSTLQALTQS